MKQVIVMLVMELLILLVSNFEFFLKSLTKIAPFLRSLC